MDCAGWKDVALLDLAESEARVVLFRVHPAIPENLGPLVRAFVEADRVWAGHISIIAATGIQMVAARKMIWSSISRQHSRSAKAPGRSSASASDPSLSGTRSARCNAPFASRFTVLSFEDAAKSVFQIRLSKSRV